METKTEQNVEELKSEEKGDNNLTKSNKKEANKETSVKITRNAKIEESTKEKLPYKYKKSEEFEKIVKQMGTYERLAHVRLEVNEYLESKSGANDEEGFNYFELKDFMPIVNNIFLKYRIIGIFGFPDDKQSKLEIKNFDDKDDTIEFTMNRVRVNMKNAMQGEGAINTYSKRYLYMNALELCDKDIFDAPQKAIESFNEAERNNNRNQKFSNTQVPKNATNNQKKLINSLAKELMKTGTESTKNEVRNLMKTESFDSLSQTLTNVYPSTVAERIISNLNNIVTNDKKQKQTLEMNKKRENDLKTQNIQESFTAGDIVELPEGEVEISESNIQDMEF